MWRQEDRELKVIFGKTVEASLDYMRLIIAQTS